MNNHINNNVKLKIIKVFNYINTTWNSGFIIDFETFGNINYDNSGIDVYNDVKPFIIGLLNLNNNELKQYYVDNGYLNSDILTDIIKTTNEPYYAFSSNFEKSIIKIFTGLDIEFRELQTPLSITVTYYEKKEFVCNKLIIDNYDDPFNGDGGMCITEFENGNIIDCLKHNEACLLKERDILNSRGYYKI